MAILVNIANILLTLYISILLIAPVKESQTPFADQNASKESLKVISDENAPRLGTKHETNDKPSANEICTLPAFNYNLRSSYALVYKPTTYEFAKKTCNKLGYPSLVKSNSNYQPYIRGLMHSCNNTAEIWISGRSTVNKCRVLKRDGTLDMRKCHGELPFICENFMDLQTLNLNYTYSSTIAVFHDTSHCKNENEPFRTSISIKTRSLIAQEIITNLDEDEFSKQNSISMVSLTLSSCSQAQTPAIHFELPQYPYSFMHSFDTKAESFIKTDIPLVGLL